MSILSLLTSLVLVGLVYGLSFVPSATLSRPDDDIELDQTVASVEDKAPDDSTRI